MPDFPEAGVRLTADISDYRSSMQEALSLANEFDSLGDLSVTITAEFDAGDIESVIPDDTTVTITPEVGDSSELTDLEALDDNPIDAKVNTQEDPNSEKIGGKSILTTLHELGINPTQIVMNIAGTLVDGLKTLGSFSVQPLLDLDSAVARVNAQTANTIPNAHELISGIFYDDLGQSVDQVANLVIQAQQIGAPIDEATRAALTFTHTFTDQDPSQVLNTMNNLVQTGLVPNFTTASDLLVTGFQEGDNRANDLLTTLNNNASALSDMGLNGQEAMSLIKSGLDGGAKSAQSVVDMLVKIKTNVTTAAGTAGGDVNALLANLGIPNPVTSGEGWSADFITKIRDAIAAAPVDDATKQQMVSTLLGGKLGAKDYSEFMNLDAADPAFNNLKDKAATAATDVDSSLSGAIDDFTLAAQKAATDFLSSDQIDLPGKITALKTGIQDALAALQGGENLGTAFVIGLKPLGLDQIALTLENAVNNLVIGVLQAVATIQSVLGQGDQSTATQKTISGLAQGALTTSLQINPESAEGVAQSVDTALKRGIDPTTIGTAMEDAVKQMVASGDFQKAQDLIDSFNKVGITLNPGQDVAGTNAGLQAGLANAQNAISRGGEGIGGRTEQDNANAQLAVLAQTQTTTALDDMASAATDLTPNIRDASDAIDDQKGGLTELKTVSTQTTASVDTLNTTTDELANAAADANLAQTDMANSLTSIIAQEQALEAQYAAGTISLDEFNQKFAELLAMVQAHPGSDEGGNMGTGTGGAVNPDAGNGPYAGGTDDASGSFMAGESGREIVTTDRRLAVLNNKTTEAIMAAVSGSLGRGNVTTNGGSKVVNLTQINNVPNQAVADALGYRTAKELR